MYYGKKGDGYFDIGEYDPAYAEQNGYKPLTQTPKPPDPEPREGKDRR